MLAYAKASRTELQRVSLITAAPAAPAAANAASHSPLRHRLQALMFLSPQVCNTISATQLIHLHHHLVTVVLPHVTLTSTLLHQLIPRHSPMAHNAHCKQPSVSKYRLARHALARAHSMPTHVCEAVSLSHASSSHTCRCWVLGPMG